MPHSGMGPPAPGRGVWSGNIVPSSLPEINSIEDLRKRIPNEFGLADRDNPLYKQVERGRAMQRAAGLGWGTQSPYYTPKYTDLETLDEAGFERKIPQTDPYLKNYGNLGDAQIPMSASSGPTGWGETYGQTPTAPTTTASGDKPATGFLANIFNDDAFTEAMRDQLAEAGADYDAADQPFKSLSPVSVPGARHQPAQMPSMLTTRGIPTGGSYNPYLGDPAKRKRPR